MKILFFLLVIVFAFSGCEFNKSVRTDLITGLTIKGDGLSSENVFLSVNDEKVSRTTFVYGEEFFVNFSNMDGFKKVDGKVFPGIKFDVINKKGDTVMHTDDLYKKYDVDGISISPLMLTTNLTIGRPVTSNDDYSMHIKIWDKKGTGTITAKMAFNVGSNKKIVLENNKVTYKEIYIYSEEAKKIVIDKISSKETIDFIFEGVSGFKESDGKVFAGMSLKATDKNRKIILDETDLFAEYTESGLSETDFKDRIYATFNLSKIEVISPLRVEVLLWDKKSDAKIKASTELKVD